MLWTRRQFVVRSLSGVALAAAWPGGSPHGSRTPLRVGIAGLGSRGRQHVAAGLLPGVTIAAMYDPDRSAASAAQDCCRAWTGRAAGIVDSYRQILADDIDLVVIAVPEEEDRLRMATDALRCGKHVYCEPPWAASPAASAGLVAAANRSGRLLWQGSHQQSWTYDPVARFASGMTGAGNTELTVTRSCAEEMTDSAEWLREWFDVIDCVAGGSGSVPGRCTSVHAQTPLGSFRDVTLRAGSHPDARVKLIDRPIFAGPQLSTWTLTSRSMERTDTLWLDVAATTTDKPSVFDLQSWQRFLDRLETHDPLVWSREHDRAHRTVLWTDAIAKASHSMEDTHART